MKKGLLVALLPLLSSCGIQMSVSAKSDSGPSESVCPVSKSDSSDSGPMEETYMNKEFGFDHITEEATFDLTNNDVELDFFYAQWQKKRNPSVFYNHTVALQYRFSDVPYPEWDRNPDYHLSVDGCEACFPISMRQGKVLFLDNGTKSFVDEHIITSGSLQYDKWEPDRCVVKTSIEMKTFLEGAKTGKYLHVFYVPYPAEDGYMYDENGNKFEWIDYKEPFHRSSLIQNYSVEITDYVVKLFYEQEPHY